MKDERNNLLFLCDYKSFYGGNFVPSLLALEDKMKQYNYSTYYAFPKVAKDRYWVKKIIEMGHNVLFLDFNQSRYNMIKSVNNLIEKYNIGIVHVHFGQVLNMEILSLLNKKAKVFIHLHSDFTGGHSTIRNKIESFVQYRLFSKCVSYICVSESFLQFNPKKTTWIPNALAIDRIPCEHKTGYQVRVENNVKENDIFCEVFGWSPYIKGVDIAVKAVNEILDEGDINIKLGIICGREITKEKMKEYIKDNTECNGEESFIVYLDPIEDVFSYHEAADFLLSTSRSEGFPYSTLEMLSIGKPCVLSNIPGNKWAKKYNIVYEFDTENIQACKTSIKKLIMDFPNVSDTVKQDISENYSITEWTEKVTNCYFTE